MKPTQEIIEKIILDCFFKDEEIVDNKAPDNSVVVKGISCTMFFHPERLNSHKEEIREILSEFPDSYMKGAGGGSTFVSFCYTKDQHLWTSEQRIMETLMCLGLGTNLIKYCLPEKFWCTLPYGMPYFFIDLKG